MTGHLFFISSSLPAPVWSPFFHRAEIFPLLCFSHISFYLGATSFFSSTCSSPLHGFTKMCVKLRWMHFFFSFAFLCVGKHNKWKEKSTKTWGKMKQSGAFFFFFFTAVSLHSHQKKGGGTSEGRGGRFLLYVYVCAADRSRLVKVWCTALTVLLICSTWLVVLLLLFVCPSFVMGCF